MTAKEKIEYKSRLQIYEKQLLKCQEESVMAAVHMKERIKLLLAAIKLEDRSYTLSRKEQKRVAKIIRSL